MKVQITFNNNITLKYSSFVKQYNKTRHIAYLVDTSNVVGSDGQNK